MSLTKILKSTLVCASFAIMAPSIASAVTLDFDGAPNSDYQFDIDRIVSGPCLVGSCLGLNTNESTTLSRVDGGTFSLSSLWFNLLGKPADLLITAYTSGNTYAFSDETLTPMFAYFDQFEDVTAIMFSNTGTGNIRIDDLMLGDTPAPVPLPAGAGLLVVALGSLGALRRRRAAK